MTLGTHISVVGNGIACDNKSSSAVILVDEKCKALMSLVTHGNNYVLFEVYCSVDRRITSVSPISQPVV